MSNLQKLEMRYAAGGRARLPKGAPHPVDTITRAMKHIKEGNHAAAITELQKSPEAMSHPNVQAAMQMMQQGAAPGMADGGSVDRPSGQSSPGSPGVLGAIHDAVHAVKDYLIDRPAREIQADREKRENSIIDGTYSGPTQASRDDGYADGGKVSAVKGMAKFMVDKLGIDSEHANRLAAQYHAAQAAPVSPVARQLSQDVMARTASPSQAKKSPAQLAQELQAGFVHPTDLNHLLYTDPTLTPLINRYQSGVDNQNLSPQQKQTLIQKLSSMGSQTPPQLPQTASTPRGIDALLSGPQQ